MPARRRVEVRTGHASLPEEIVPVGEDLPSVRAGSLIIGSRKDRAKLGGPVDRPRYPWPV